MPISPLRKQNQATITGSSPLKRIVLHDTSKMKNFEVSTMNLLDNEDMVKVHSVHTLG